MGQKDRQDVYKIKKCFEDRQIQFTPTASSQTTTTGAKAGSFRTSSGANTAIIIVIILFVLIAFVAIVFRVIKNRRQDQLTSQVTLRPNLTSETQSKRKTTSR